MKHPPANPLPCMRDWVEERIVGPARQREAARQERRAALAQTKVRTPTTAEELAAIAAISPGRVTYVPGIATKRFARDIQGATELTELQRVYLWGVVWRYRRQIADTTLVERARELNAEAQRRLED